MGSARYRYLAAAVIAFAAGMITGYPGFFVLAASFVAAAIASSRMRGGDPYYLDYGRKLQLNTRSTQEPVRLIYGKVKVGGNDVYISTSGEDNKTMWIVQTLGEGECEGVDVIGSDEQIWVEDEFISSYPSSLISYYFHSGSFSQNVDSNLNSARPEWTDPLRGTCYIIWKLMFDTDYFLRAPGRTLILKGRILYDFRDETTAWSDNPVLALYDYLTNTRYGMGIPAANIDLTSWISTANYCETKGWVINYGIVSLEDADSIINNIMSVFRGELVWFNNKLQLFYTDLNYESSVMSISDEHIAIEEGTGKALISMAEPSKFGSPDGLRVGFVDPNKEWSTDNVIIGESTGVVSDFNLVGCTSKQQALDLGVYQLERMQHQESIVGTFRDDLAILDPHDVVNLTCTSLAISGELLRVQSVDLRPDGLVDISFMAEDILFYDDDYNLTQDSLFECTLPDPKSVPPEVVNPGIEEELYWYRLRSFSRINISFSEPDNFPWFSHVEVWRSSDGENWDYLYDVNTDFTVDPVEEKVTHYFRLRTVSIFGIKRPFEQSTPLQLLVTGKTAAPASLTSLTAVATDLGVNLYANKVSDPDVELYEFRLSGWTGGIFLGAYRSPNLSLKGVKPGFFVFYCNTLANNDIYGNSPVSASATVKDPKGWTLDQQHAGDYSSGIFANMERVWYNSEWFLKCSHGGNQIENGTFDTALEWITTAGWSISGGKANCVAPGSETYVYQTAGFIQGQTYRVTWTVSNYVQGNVRVRFYGMEPGYQGPWRNGNGTYVDDIVCSFTEASAHRFYVMADSTFIGSVDDITVEPLSPYIGEYWSPIYDLSLIDPETFLTYIQADITVTGAGTRWQDVLYEGATMLKWSQVGVNTKKWYEIFALPHAPKVSMKLIWGVDSAYMDYEAERMEILSTVLTGKYIQLHVRIEDPASNVFAYVENYNIRMLQ